MNDRIRALLGRFGGLPVAVGDIKDDADLYAAGLSSFASVQLMLGIEEEFDIEFPDNLLNRKSFASIAAIEKTKHFNGAYHVLHGSLSPLHGVGPAQLRISNLVRRVESGNVDEVIIATNPTVEGEATATYLSQQLRRQGLKITRIAMGIPVGSDIEYTDEITMLKAMEGRREV